MITSIFDEIGILTDNKGELTLMIEWSWRVKKYTIWFGSLIDPDKVIQLIPKLVGYTLHDISNISVLFKV